MREEKKTILLLGTCNPVGEAEDYNGLYFTDNELQRMHAGGDLKEIPVKQEHTSTTVGKVVSTLLDNHGNLQCILDIDENTIEGGLAAGFVRDGVASELSLGYIVDVQNSNDKLTAQKKQVVEVSLVRKGARQNCHIHAYESQDAALVWKKGVDSWYAFNI